MKQKGWRCRTKPKKVSNLGQTYDVTENKLERDFQAEKPLEKLMTDITYRYFGQCKLWLSCLMDLYNQKIVADTMSETQGTEFVLDTLNQLDLAPGALLYSNQEVV